jgi:hypothetical protein
MTEAVMTPSLSFERITTTANANSATTVLATPVSRVAATV